MTDNITLNILEESNFLLKIPINVEKKIRYHINKFPHTEWSGFLFYDYTGSFEEDNLIFTARDFVVLDIGTGGATSFADCPKVCTYAIDHDLLDCKEALIHSHHAMGAFFSGTDDNAIKQEAMNCNHFLSLVVDTKGTYVARVTKRNVIKRSIHQTVIEEVCYPTYEDQIVCNTGQTEKVEDFITETSEVIVYPLKIEVEKYEEDNIAEWEADIKEARETSLKNIDAQRLRELPYNNIPRYSASDGQVQTTPFPLAKKIFNNEKSSELSIFSDKDYQDSPHIKEEIVDKDVPTCNKETMTKLAGMDEEDIDKAVQKMIKDDEVAFLALQILCGSPFARQDRVTLLNQYAVKLPTVVTERFATDVDYFSFIDGFIDMLMLEYEKTCDIDEFTDIYMSYVAIAMQELLETVVSNKYVKHIIDQLNAYLL